MTLAFEARLDDGLVRLEGSVLEVFGIGRLGAARYHVDVVRELAVDGGALKIVCGDSSVVAWGFPEDQRAQVEQVVEAALAARA